MLAEISINLPLKTTKHFKDLIQMNSATSRTRYCKSAHCCPNVKGQVPYLIEQITYFCKNQSLCYFHPQRKVEIKIQTWEEKENQGDQEIQPYAFRKAQYDYYYHFTDQAAKNWSALLIFSSWISSSGGD